MRVVSRKRLASLCLMAGTFFLPFGYDVVFKMILDSTGSYWITTSIFYLVSGAFFGLSILFNQPSQELPSN